MFVLGAVPTVWQQNEKQDAVILSNLLFVIGDNLFRAVFFKQRVMNNDFDCCNNQNRYCCKIAMNDDFATIVGFA